MTGTTTIELFLDNNNVQLGLDQIVFWQKCNLTIWQLECRIYCGHLHQNEECSIPHPFCHVLQSMSTLEHVTLISQGMGKVSIDPFLDAIHQNDSIHTIQLSNIICSAIVVKKLLQGKAQLEVEHYCIIGNPASSPDNKYTCNLEAFHLINNDWSVMSFLSSF